jgi:hypothetical protein
VVSKKLIADPKMAKAILSWSVREAYKLGKIVSMAPFILAMPPAQLSKVLNTYLD